MSNSGGPVFLLIRTNATTKEATDRLASDISKLVGVGKVVAVFRSSGRGMNLLLMRVAVGDDAALKMLVRQIEGMPGVSSVERVDLRSYSVAQRGLEGLP